MTTEATTPTLENFVRFTGFQPRVATRLFAPVKLVVAGLLIAGLAVPALSVAGAAATVLISLVYLARLLAPRRRDPAGLVGFMLFGLIGATLLAVRLIG
jgi:apolipoprotein N-acyltransferase